MREWDVRLFRLFNDTIRHAVLDRLLRLITHLGSAGFTIAASLTAAIFAPSPWNRVGWQSLAALTASFLIGVAVKKTLKRQRPYLALPNANLLIKRLRDSSFPSGHTTAAFSVFVPFAAAAAWAACVVLPAAALIAVSRVYLGVHYPSDCAVGCLLGSSAALLAVHLF
ncbi:phosphatase PAP2 family protein [Cohnella sp. REN36]|uniref:phosphatase PAP2 family protein n=1 Tax=Cohnella sp. REN36 TaxID=2887347 RepID=UPI001D135B18|nr:phosphatase PAP2 family protein [Cohnella sp. REN36]MCC3372541.1 phosphatase PAP2 family protein [Cohnella sp. REN36]